MKETLTQHFGVVFGYIALRVHPDRELARDLCQDVFRAAIGSRSELRLPTAERAWLLGIARRRVADYFRSRPPAALLFDEGEYDAECLDPEGEKASRVAATLQRLSEVQRDLLDRKYLEGAAVRVMAIESGMTEKAVESALSRARRAFREIYAELVREEERA